MISENIYSISFIENQEPRDLTLSLWQYDSSVLDYFDLLSEEEKVILNNFKVDSRKNEFIAGRILAKKAIAKHQDVKNLNDISIVNGVWGFPVIKYKFGAEVWISIAHTKNYAAVLFSKLNTHPIGLDFEEISIKNKKSLSKYLSHYNISDSLEMLHIYWVAKEAVAKTILTGFTISDSLFEIKDCSLIDNCYNINFLHFQQIKATAWIDNGLAICVAYPSVWDKIKTVKI